jgi:nitrate reductase delta subunit|tara:strand:- start:782 stop:1399 length:618 start_codon:yes stop_codon:yes gene_type:complete
MNGHQVLKDVYALIAELWCSPPEEDAEREATRKEAEEVVARLESIDKESAMLLSRFLEENDISEEDYIDLFELDPRCALYLGSHAYDEPTTCATAGVSDRNEYMISLGGIYNHFGRKTNGKELPDYLPLMVNFLSLTSESKNDPVRDKFIEEYILPFLPPMRARLEELETPYLHLLDALEKVINIEQKTEPLSKQREQKVETHVG